MTRAIDVYYDRSCALCRGEVEALAAAAGEGTLRLHDCSGKGFRDDAAERDGVDRDAMLRAMHVRDADGRWHRGVGAFVVMYRAAGVEPLARAWGHPRLKPLEGWLAKAFTGGFEDTRDAAKQWREAVQQSQKSNAQASGQVPTWMAGLLATAVVLSLSAAAVWLFQ